ncbi:MAG: cell envelope integrity protein TolA [Francisellaceae bacterium]
MSRMMPKRILSWLKRCFDRSTSTFERRSYWYSFILHIVVFISILILGIVFSTRDKPLRVNITESENNGQTTVNATILQQSSVNIMKPVPVAIKKVQKTAEVDRKLDRLQDDFQQKFQQAIKRQAIEKRRQQEIDAQKQKEQERQLALQKQKREQEQKKQLEVQKEQAEKMIEKDADTRDSKPIQSQQKQDQGKKSSAMNAKSATQSQIAENVVMNYALSYQKRIEANWVTDACRRVINGKRPVVLMHKARAPVITVSSGNAACDQSLIKAIDITQAPKLPDDQKARELIDGGIEFKFDLRT